MFANFENKECFYSLEFAELRVVFLNKGNSAVNSQ